MQFGPTMATLLACLAAAMPAAATTPTATVRFGTSCAHCHEGECSGRLSFAQDPEAAFAHIRQYAGPTDDELARQLSATLARMKSDCRYPPMAVASLDRGLDAAGLAPFLDPWSGDYFLPLGGLAPGSYRLIVDVDGGGRVRIELIDAGFDPLIDRCLTPDGPRLELAVVLGDSREYFLRLRPRGPLRVQRVTLVGAG